MLLCCDVNLLRDVQERLDNIAASVFTDAQHLELHLCAFATCAQAEMVNQSVSHNAINNLPASISRSIL